MGYCPDAGAATALAHDLTLTVTSMGLAEALAGAAARTGRAIPLHVKIDSGMGRFGLLPDEALDFIRGLRRLPGLILEGIYTHFAAADLADKSYTRQQLATFRDVLAALAQEGIQVPIRHAANSAAALDLPETHLDAVRPGIAMYGLRPSDEVEPAVRLRPALTLKSRVGHVHTLAAGSSISYGRTFVTQRGTPVALVPVGYGDGYMRLNSNRGAVLIRGQRAPIRGRVCMDQFVVEVSGIEGVTLNDEVVLIGRQGEQTLSAEEVAGWAETNNYEVVTQLLPRVPRIYLRGGQIIA
jgi:alanine racemase